MTEVGDFKGRVGLASTRTQTQASGQLTAAELSNILEAYNRLGSPDQADVKAWLQQMVGKGHMDRQYAELVRAGLERFDAAGRGAQPQAVANTVIGPAEPEPAARAFADVLTQIDANRERGGQYLASVGDVEAMLSALRDGDGAAARSWLVASQSRLDNGLVRIAHKVLDRLERNPDTTARAVLGISESSRPSQPAAAAEPSNSLEARWDRFDALLRDDVFPESRRTNLKFWGRAFFTERGALQVGPQAPNADTAIRSHLRRLRQDPQWQEALEGVTADEVYHYLQDYADLLGRAGLNQVSVRHLEPSQGVIPEEDFGDAPRRTSPHRGLSLAEHIEAVSSAIRDPQDRSADYFRDKIAGER